MAILAKNDLSGIYSWKATKPFTSHSGVHQDQEVVYAFSHFTKKNEWLTLEQEQFLKTYSLNPVHVGTLVDVDAVAAAAASSPQDQQQQQQHQQQPFTNSQPPDSASNNSPLAAAFPEVPQVSSMKDFYQDSWYQQNYHPSHNYHAGAEQEQHAFYHQQQQQEQQHSSVNSDPNTAAGAIRAGAIVAITEGGVVHERQTSGLRRLNTDNIVRPLTINSQHFSLVSVPTASSSSTSLRRELDLGPVPVVVSSGESSEIPFALPISQSQPPKIKAPTAHTQELAAPHVASYHPNDRKLFAPTVGTSSGTSSMQNQLLRQNEAEAPVASSSSSSPPSATGELESSLAQLQVSIGKSSRRPRVSLPPSTAFPPPASAYASGEISSQHTRPESSRGILSAPVRTISKEASASVPAAATIYQPVASSSSSLSSFHRRRPSWTPGDDAHLIANMNSVPPTSNEDHESDFGSIVDSDDEHEVEPVV